MMKVKIHFFKNGEMRSFEDTDFSSDELEHRCSLFCKDWNATLISGSGTMKTYRVYSSPHCMRMLIVRIYP